MIWINQSINQLLWLACVMSHVICRCSNNILKTFVLMCNSVPCIIICSVRCVMSSECCVVGQMDDWESKGQKELPVQGLEPWSGTWEAPVITTYTILDVLLFYVLTCPIINTQQVFTKEHHQSQERRTLQYCSFKFVYNCKTDDHGSTSDYDRSEWYK